MNKAEPRPARSQDGPASESSPALPDSAAAPFEPAASALDEPQAAESLRAIQAFFQGGRSAPAECPDDAWPALLHRYRNLGEIRHDYPLLVNPEGEVRPLSQVFDELLETLPAEGDDAQRLRRDLLRLESQLRIDTQPRTLGEAWDLATEAVLAGSEQRPEVRQRIERNLGDARAALAGEGRLLPCHGHIGGTLAEVVCRRWWPGHVAALGEEIDAIIQGLKDILRAEYERSEAARDPAHLREAVGTADADDLDFERLSDILTRSKLEQPLPEGRHARIDHALGILAGARPLFGPALAGEHAEPTLELAPVRNDCLDAARRHGRRMHLMAEVFRAAEIGRLELDNHYRAAVHDPWFAGFGPDRLEPDQRALCPPVLLVLDGDFDDRDQAGDLLAVLASGAPIKIVVELAEHACTSEPRWVARLADLARSFNQPWVAQVSASNTSDLHAALLGALDHPGPALVAVYGGSGGTGRLPPYLECAAALEARVVPSWRYDPAAGPTQAERMALLDNPSPQAIWSTEAFEYRDSSGENRTIEQAFTAAEVLLCEKRLSGHFMVLEPNQQHPELVPIKDYLGQTEAQRTNGLPYLLAVNADGELLRLVPDRWVIDQVLRCADDWHTLQEAAGIGNSHALRLLSAEQAELARQRDAGIESARQDYERQLDQDLGELTRVIVGRIADGLLGTATGPLPGVPGDGEAAVPAVDTPDADAPAAVDEPEAEQATEPPPPEEDDFALDDPYIDTALCTSCDDCTTLNPAMFAYDENKQAYIKDPLAGTFRELVQAAEKCPVRIIHPGKPANPDEPDLETWIERAKAFQ